MRDKLIEILRSVPITDKTYSEYIEAVAERLIAEDYRKIYDDYQRQCTCYALGCQMAERLKRKVAEEIFAEIEKIVLAGIEKDEHFREKMQAPTDRSYFEGGANSQRKIAYLIAELKKKYTEE